MQDIVVTPKVWDRILTVRAGHGCLCDPNWSEGEKQALSIYGTLAQPKSSGQVIAQIGQSLDGRIATESGDAKDISGKDGLKHLHRLRALSDAVVIGVKTALHDNPRLTVRMVEGQNPARVIIDPSGRMPDHIGLMQDRSARCIVIQSVDKQRPDHIEVVKLPRNDWISATQILEALQKRGLNRILVEGGGITIAKFLEAGLLTHLHVAVAPLLIGAGPQGLNTSPVERLSQALRPKTDVYKLGSDVLFDCMFESEPVKVKPYPLPCRTAVHTS